MADPPQPDDRLLCRCSACGKEYRLPAHYLGKAARCNACQQTFTVTQASAAPQASAQTAAPAGQGTPPPPPPPPSKDCILCTVCQQPIEPQDATADCPECQAPYHQECWQYNQGCGIYGCGQAPETETLKNVEIPASYWGKEEKNCPSCGREIRAAALRCTNCGAMFASAKPQDRRAYRQRQFTQERLPKVGRVSIAMLVLSILSCTAPLVAVFGSMWYLANRKDIQTLPGTQSAICRIALGLAYLQTLVIIVVYLFFSSS